MEYILVITICITFILSVHFLYKDSLHTNIMKRTTMAQYYGHKYFEKDRFEKLSEENVRLRNQIKELQYQLSFLNK